MELSLAIIPAPSHHEDERLLSPAKLKSKKSLQAMDKNLQNQSLEAAHITKDTMVTGAKHSLSAWLHCFDIDHNDKIDFDEFCLGMNKLNYEGDIVALWKALDVDGSGVLDFYEIDDESADMWSSFRRWAGSTFDSGRDMITKLNRNAGKSTTAMVLKQEVFVEGIAKFGYTGLMETLLFYSLDHDHKGFITLQELKWLDSEAKKQQRKMFARMRAQGATEKHLKNKVLAARVLVDFKNYLKQEYGCLFKAWRKCIDLDGSMSVQKAELFKACCKMGWKGDVRRLWSALDSDGSGSTTLEEVDPDCASLLAKFKQWADENWGSAKPCFRALDRHRARRMKLKEFADSCKRFGFIDRPKTLFHWLDWDGKKYLTEEDFECLDSWRPSPWLMASPNEEAVKDIKRLIFQKYKHFVKAWRVCLDRDSSNRVNYCEFDEACKKVGFRGDVAGAWLTLDDDLSGYITLREIDKDSAETLMRFKQWADHEFGGVQCAFWVLDADGSGELTFREFRRATRDFGYTDDPQILFECLDCDGAGRLSLNEVAFLDSWDTSNSGDIRRLAIVDEPPPDVSLLNPVKYGDAIMEYKTFAPAPNTYEILPTLGTTPTMPTSRHYGTVSFKKPASRRFVPPWKDSEKTVVESMAPTKYKPNVAQVKRRKPAWGFGSASRKPQYLAKSDAAEEPGPGAYDELEIVGPRWSVVPRRRMKMHPESPQPPGLLNFDKHPASRRL